MAEARGSGTNAAFIQGPTSTLSVLKKLRELKKILNCGLMSQQEYQSFQEEQLSLFAAKTSNGFQALSALKVAFDEKLITGKQYESARVSILQRQYGTSEASASVPSTPRVAVASLPKENKPKPGSALAAFLASLCDHYDVTKARGCELTEVPLTGELIGRKQELAAMLYYLSQSGDRRTHVIQTAAPPGAGKSALFTKISQLIFSNDFDSFAIPSTENVVQMATPETSLKPDSSPPPKPQKLSKRQIKFLRSLFPIAITWNHRSVAEVDETKFSEESINASVAIKAKFKASIAVRVAFSFFVADKPNASFTNFQRQFENAIKTGDDDTIQNNVLEEVIEQVNKCLCAGSNKKTNILFIVDEPAKTGSPKAVRNMLYKIWLAEHENSRMIISSLTPNDLGKDITGITPFWVQLTSFCLSTQDLSRIIDDIARKSEDQWLSKLFRTEVNHQSKLFVSYLLKMAGSNWRAVVRLATLVSAPPQSPLDDVNAVLDSKNGVSIAVKGVSSYFLSPQKCNLAVHKFLLNAVLRQQVDLNNKRTHFGEKSTQAWLLIGLLSNRIPNPDAGKVLEVPQLPMIIIHNWLDFNLAPETLESKGKKRKKDAGVVEIEKQRKMLVALVAKLWKNASIPKVSDSSSPLRFELMMANWLALFLFCLNVSHQQTFYLASEQMALFPGLKLFKRKNQIYKDTKIKFVLPETPVTMDIITVLDFQIFRKEKPKTVIKSKEPLDAAVFICEKGEAAMDLMLWVQNKLVLVQCRLYKHAMSTKQLQKDVNNLTKHFRGKLWTTGKERDIPFVAAQLGLPSILERDVVFVLLSPNGLAVPQESNQPAVRFKNLFEQVNITKVPAGGSKISTSAAATTKVHADASAALLPAIATTKVPTDASASLPSDPNFQGRLLLPGNKEQLNKRNQYHSTWLDEVLGTTFAPLVHLLGLQS